MPLRLGHRLAAARCAVEREWLCVVAVAWFAAVLFVVGPALITQDSWLTLVAGREVAQHGIPHVDSFAVVTRGRDWIDQQWLAQLTYYGATAVGGLLAAYLVHVTALLAAVTAAVAAARHRGGSMRSVALVVPFMLLAAPWSWDLRAQALAYLPFVLVLWLLVDSRAGARPRVLLVLPLLVIWANLHGSVLIGSGLCLLWAFSRLLARSRPQRPDRSIAGLVGVCSLLAPLASPYGLSIAGYYRRMLVDPPFQGLIVEWKRTPFEPLTVLFWLAVLAFVVAVLRARASFTWFELAAMAVLLVLAVDVVRNVVWFALALAMLLPQAVDRIVPRLARRTPGRLDRTFLYVMSAATLVVAAYGVSTFSGRVRASWPETVPDEVAAVVAARPETGIYASERLADWMLWKRPALRGHVAFDARVELLGRGEVDRIVDFESGLLRDGWPITAYPIVVLTPDDREAVSVLTHDRAYRSLAGDARAVALVRG